MQPGASPRPLCIPFLPGTAVTRPLSPSSEGQMEKTRVHSPLLATEAVLRDVTGPRSLPTKPFQAEKSGPFSFFAAASFLCPRARGTCAPQHLLQLGEPRPACAHQPPGTLAKAPRGCVVPPHQPEPVGRGGIHEARTRHSDLGKLFLHDFLSSKC